MKENTTYNWRNLWIAWCMPDIIFADTCDLGTQVNYFAPGFDQSVKYNVAIEIDYTDTHKSFTFGSFYFLKTERNDFAFPITNGYYIILLTFHASSIG